MALQTAASRAVMRTARVGRVPQAGVAGSDDEDCGSTTSNDDFHDAVEYIGDSGVRRAPEMPRATDTVAVLPVRRGASAYGAEEVPCADEDRVGVAVHTVVAAATAIHSTSAPPTSPLAAAIANNSVDDILSNIDVENGDITTSRTTSADKSVDDNNATNDIGCDLTPRQSSPRRMSPRAGRMPVQLQTRNSSTLAMSSVALTTAAPQGSMQNITFVGTVASSARQFSANIIIPPMETLDNALVVSPFVGDDEVDVTHFRLLQNNNPAVAVRRSSRRSITRNGSSSAMGQGTTNTSTTSGDASASTMPNATGKDLLTSSRFALQPDISYEGMDKAAMKPILPSAISVNDAQSTKWSKRKIALPRNPFFDDELRRLHRWVHCFVTVTFDLEIGQLVELVYPVPSDSGSNGKPPLLTNLELKTVAFSAFPDNNSAAHVGDTVFSFRFRKSNLTYFLENDKAPSSEFEHLDKLEPPVQEGSTDDISSTIAEEPSNDEDSAAPEKRRATVRPLARARRVLENDTHRHSMPVMESNSQIYLYEDYLDAKSTSPRTRAATASAASGNNGYHPASEVKSRIGEQTLDTSSEGAFEPPRFSLRKSSFAESVNITPANSSTSSVQSSFGRVESASEVNASVEQQKQRSATSDSDSSVGYMYAYVFFRQQRDPRLKRGYFQKSLVLLSRHPWHGFFTNIVSRLGPKFMDLATLDRDLDSALDGEVDRGQLGTTTEYNSNSEVVKLLRRACLDIIFRWPQSLQHSPTLPMNALTLPAVALLNSSGGVPQSSIASTESLSMELSEREAEFMRGQRDISMFYAFPRSVDDSIFLVPQTCTIPFLGHKTDFVFPPDGISPQFHEQARNDLDSQSLMSSETNLQYARNSSSDTPILTCPAKLFEIFSGNLELLWVCWELVITGSSIIIMADAPRSCSEVAWCLTELVKPMPFGGDVRPYFTIQDFDSKLIANRSVPPPAGTIVGVTNPVFYKMFDKWGAVIHASRSTKSNSRYKMPPIKIDGFDGKQRGFLSKDKKLIKTVIELSIKGKEEAVLSNMLRRHFVDLTEQFLQPLHKYFISELLVKGPEQISFNYLRNMPEIRPFQQESFLSDISSQRKDYASSLGILRKIAKRPLVDFYRAFLMTSNFALWLQSTVRKTQSRWNEQYLAVLTDKKQLNKWLAARFRPITGSSQAFEDITGGSGIVECIDVILRMREEVAKSEDRLERYIGPDFKDNENMSTSCDKPGGQETAEKSRSSPDLHSGETGPSTTSTSRTPSPAKRADWSKSGNMYFASYKQLILLRENIATLVSRLPPELRVGFR